MDSLENRTETEDLRDVVGSFAGVDYYDLAELMRAIATSKAGSKVAPKVVRQLGREEKAERAENRERMAAKQIEIAAFYKAEFHKLFSVLVHRWNELGFETEQLSLECVGFVQDGQREGYSPGEICTNITLAVPTIQSPVICKSDDTVEAHKKATERTPDKGIVRGKSESEKHAH